MIASLLESEAQRASPLLGSGQVLQEASGAGPHRCMALTWCRPCFVNSPVRVGQSPMGNGMGLKSWLVTRVGAQSSP